MRSGWHCLDTPYSDASYASSSSSNRATRQTIPLGESKDVADAVAGLVGYLSFYGHAELRLPQNVPITGKELHDSLGLPPPVSFLTEGEHEDDWAPEVFSDPVDFETH
jgi:hypothetical protein